MSIFCWKAITYDAMAGTSLAGDCQIITIPSLSRER